MSKSTLDQEPQDSAAEQVVDSTFTDSQPQESPLDPVAVLQAEVEKWKDTALRSAAELDNFRKRSARDMQDARAYANGELLRTLLPILDTFEMGHEAARAEGEGSIIFQGLSMVRGQFQNFLKEQGVEEINALSQPFDPNLHEAMMQEAHPDVPEGNVVRIMRRGFRLKDRLLRAAAVAVSSGPAK